MDKTFMEKFIQDFDSYHTLTGDTHSLANRLARYSIEDEVLKEDIELCRYMLSEVYVAFKKELKK